MAGAQSENVQFKAVESVLDRSSNAPKREIHSAGQQSNYIQINITRGELESMRQAASELGVDVGPVPDIDGPVLIDAATGQVMVDEELQ